MCISKCNVLLCLFSKPPESVVVSPFNQLKIKIKYGQFFMEGN